MSYVCASFDELTNECLEWVVMQPFGLPPMTEAEAFEVGTLIVLTWITAFGFALLARQFFNR